MLIGLGALRVQFLPSLSERYLADLARRGVIPAVRVGRRWMFDGPAVVAALKGASAPSPVAPHIADETVLSEQPAKQLTGGTAALADLPGRTAL